MEVNTVSTPSDKTVIDFLKDLPRSFVEAERVAKFERDAVAYKCEQFYNGQHQLYMADNGWWYPIDDGELYWVVNLFAYYVRANAKEFTKSHPEMMFRAMAEDFQADAAARAASQWWKSVETKHFTEMFLQREGKRLQLHGGAWRYVRWSPAAGGMKSEPQLVPTIQRLGDGGFACRTCEMTGPQEAIAPSPEVNMPTCPSCGSLDVEIVPETEVETLVPEGEVSYPVGDLVIEQPDHFEMWCQSGARSLEDSLWLRRHRRVDRAKVEFLYPGSKLRPYVISVVNDRGPLFQRRLERTYGGADKAIESMTDQPSEREVEYTEDWFRPEVYFTYVSPQDDILPNGDPIMMGQSLIELYPNGIKVIRSGETLLDCMPENFHDHFEYIPYDVLAGRFWGKGVEDAIPIQENYNETISLIFTNIMNCDSPVTLYDYAIVKKPGIPGTPSRLIAVGDRPAGMKLGDAMTTLPGQQLPTEVWRFLEMLNTNMQLVFGAFSTFAGAPDVKVDTATGMALLDENARSIIGMPLALRAQCEARFAKKCLKLFQQNGSIERMVVGDYSQIESKLVSQADIQTDFQITVKPGSHMPRQEYQNRNDLLEYLNALRVVVGPMAQIATPAVMLELATRFNVPTGMADPLIAERNALRVIEAAHAAIAQAEQAMMQPEAQMAVMAMGPPPPEMILMAIDAAVPIRFWTDPHMQIASWLQAYGNTDQGLNEPPIMQQFIDTRIQQHLMAEGQRQMMTQGLMMQGAMMGATGGPPGAPGEESPASPLESEGTPAEEANPNEQGLSPARDAAQRLPLMQARST